MASKRRFRGLNGSVGFKKVLCFNSVFGFSASEKQSGEPKTAYCNESVNYSRENIALAAEYPCYYIKSEKSYRTPVKSADNTKE